MRCDTASDRRDDGGSRELAVSRRQDPARASDAAAIARSGEIPPEIAIILSSVEDGLRRLKTPAPDLDGVCELLHVIAVAAGATTQRKAPVEARARRLKSSGGSAPKPTGGGPQVAKGGLSRWQQKRAVDLMTPLERHPPSVSELAEACRLSNGYFIKAFKQTFGVTPRRWRQLLRVEQAKGLLVANQLSIAEVALACGFADQSHLTRVFSQVVGVPPARWRRCVDGLEIATAPADARRAADPLSPESLSRG